MASKKTSKTRKSKSVRGRPNKKPPTKKARSRAKSTKKSTARSVAKKAGTGPAKKKTTGKPVTETREHLARHVRFTPTSTPVMEGEPLLDTEEIQGNIIAAFNKPHIVLLGLRIGDAPEARRWVRTIAPRITNTSEVFAFRRLHRLVRRRRGLTRTGMSTVWMHIAFSHAGIRKLVPEEAGFLDVAFRQGLVERAGNLGDPVRNPQAEGHPNNWVVGGPGRELDVLMIVAGDDPSHLRSEVDRVLNEIDNEPGLTVAYEEAGARRPDLPGHEHFGFSDGISQPGTFGRASGPDRTPLTRRYLRDSPRAGLEGLPGQQLLWPGEFVFGYPAQDLDSPSEPGPPRRAGPVWARNGSYLVFRRLRQDVTEFWRVVKSEAQRLAQQPEFADVTPEKLASLLVGRWPSGTPISRSRDRDVLELGKDRFANNHFGFLKDTQPSTLVPIPDYDGDHFPQAAADFLGSVCPVASHIRKMNPRDLPTDQGGATKSLLRRILRRGIPFGDPIADPGARDSRHGNRGLLFLCYQTSIEKQFEFLSRVWANSTNKPQSVGGVGHDLIIGQNPTLEQQRERFLTLRSSTGPVQVKMTEEFVIPTGGGYFFSPSIGALSEVLGR